MKKALINFLVITIFTFVSLGIFGYFYVMTEISNNQSKKIGKSVIKNNFSNKGYIKNEIASENTINTETIGNEILKNETNVIILNEHLSNKKKITDWRLILVNYENQLPADFTITLSNIDDTRQFDSRAIEYLNEMLLNMKQDGVDGAWVQSAYRSVEYQQQIYDEKVQEIMEYGVSKEEAENMTSQAINLPRTSEHNLGLAVDFNYVDTDFENTEAFRWLQENAQEYGFILRYKKEKEEITKVIYEPWHWRFVGKEHAVIMNDLDMCLEEYIEYLCQ